MLMHQSNQFSLIERLTSNFVWYLILFQFPFLISISGFAQFIDQSVHSKPVPPSPQAASLLKFTEIPVSYYTGSSQIIIPIYDIKGSDINLPIQLTYSYNGLKVDEIASWCGLGWNLNATGVVGRTVMDVPDEYASGYFSTEARKYFRSDGTPILDSCSNPPSGLSANELYSWALNTMEFYDRSNSTTGPINENFIDTEPDIYHFSTPSGISGKFVMDLEGNIRMIPKKPIDIDFWGSDVNNKQFKINDDKGILYQFGDAKERINTFTVCDNFTGSTKYGLEPVSSWFITQMTSLKTNETVNFTYENEATQYYTADTQSKSFLIGASTSGGKSRSSELDFSCRTTTHVDGVRLSSISYENISILFEEDAQSRLDIQGGHRLKEIKVFVDGVLLKRFVFYHSYFGNGANSYLQLDSLVEYGENDKRLPAYKFNYFEGAGLFPSRGSFDQDYWGYYNAAGNTTFLPNYQEPLYQINNRTGANRKTNVASMKLGSLEKVTYPTGGFAVYEYEANKINDVERIPHSVSVSAQATSPIEGQAHVDYEEFTITTQTYVELLTVDTYESPEGGIVANCGCDLQRLDGYYYQYLAKNSQDRFLLLEPGIYRLKSSIPTMNSPVDHVTCSVGWSVVTGNLIQSEVGGLRIKSIKKYDGISIEPVLSKRLEYLAEDGTSSGKLLAASYFWYDMKFGDGYISNSCEGELPAVPGSLPKCCDDEKWTIQRILKSANLVQPTIAQGSIVGYSRVSEFNIHDGPAAKSVYTYYNNIYSPSDLHVYPPSPNVYLTYQGDFLISKKDYDANGSIIKEVINFPTFGSETQKDRVYGFQLAKINAQQCPLLCDYIKSDYIHLSEPMATDSTVEIDYSGSSILVKATKYFYEMLPVPGTDDFFALRSFKTKDSNNRTWVTELKYPYDYRNTNMELNKMYMANIVVPVWQVVKNELDNVFDARITNYSNYKPVNYFDLDLNSTILYSSISSIVDLTNPGNGFIEKESYIYSSDNNLIAIAKPNNITYSFLWDSGSHNNLIAEAVGCNPDRLFYTSFEEDGVIGHSKTGNRYFEGSTFTFQGILPTGSDLLMTYWYYDGTWKFQTEIPFTSTISRAGATRYDEVRVYPAGVQMSTYTYKAGIGITSVTDYNNLTTYYNYDEFGRLKFVKDNNGNVLKSFKYHYKDQR